MVATYICSHYIGEWPKGGGREQKKGWKGKIMQFELSRRGYVSTEICGSNRLLASAMRFPVCLKNAFRVY